MISLIKSFFENELAPGDETLSQDKLHLACAALLIEVAVIDEEFASVELSTLQDILVDQYDISKEQCETLVSLAKKEQSDATSMYQFTQLVNDNCRYEDKFALVKGMWSVAFADGNLDKYEEYIIRKTSELIHLSHNDFIRAKKAAKSA